jgi:hypothetical protein
MPRVGFETMTPVFERVKTVDALDRAATVIGTSNYTNLLIPLLFYAANSDLLTVS